LAPNALSRFQVSPVIGKFHFFPPNETKEETDRLKKKNWIETLFLTEQQLSPLKRLSFCVCFLRYQLFGWGGSSIHRKKYWASLDHHFKLNNYVCMVEVAYLSDPKITR
jgi:hypothetical protein